MRALLDTHTLIWWLVDDPRLSRAAREVLQDAASELLWSAASSWELAIKAGLGKLTLPEPPRSLIPRVMRDQALTPLAVSHPHALAVAELPPHHRDPFDRLLIAQCTAENVAILTGDEVFRAYEVAVVW